MLVTLLTWKPRRKAARPEISEIIWSIETRDGRHYRRTFMRGDSCWWRINYHLALSNHRQLPLRFRRTPDVNDADVITDPNSFGKLVWKLITHSSACIKNVWWHMSEWLYRGRNDRNARKRYSMSIYDYARYVECGLNLAIISLHVSLLSLNDRGKKINKDACTIAFNWS